MNIPHKVKPGYLKNKISNLRPLRDAVLVSEMNFEFRVTTAGIILPGDDAKDSGIRPRWAKVYAIGPEQKDVSVGQWILIDHGRWTRGVNVEDQDGNQTAIRKVDNKDILLVSDEQVFDDIIGTKVV